MELYINAKFLQWYKVNNYLATFENLTASFQNAGNTLDLKVNICIDFTNKLIMLYNVVQSNIVVCNNYRPIQLESATNLFYDLKKLHDWDQLKIFLYGDDNFFSNYKFTFALHPFNDTGSKRKLFRK